MAKGAKGGDLMKTICLHGPESTGKSTMATLLAAHFDCEIVPEYGRAYCEEHGTDTAMHDLIVIAERHATMTRSALSRAKDWLILDTDPVMTAVWAEMQHGRQDAWFASFDAYADIYLLLDIDLPWVDDGLRVYGVAADRKRFFDLSKAELERRGVRWALISGDGEPRFDAALAAIASVP
jgi:NadR type nicotinamide-nucleotide adenylyltransferase